MFDKLLEALMPEDQISRAIADGAGEYREKLLEQLDTDLAFRLPIGDEPPTLPPDVSFRVEHPGRSAKNFRRQPKPNTTKVFK